MMARRTGAQQTGRKIAERSRGGKQKSPKPRKTPRGATPRPKRAAVSAADGAEVIRTIRESSVERTGQSASRDETRVLGAPTGGPPVGPQLGDISSAWVVLDSWWNSALARRVYDRCGAGRGREGRTEGDAFLRDPTRHVPKAVRYQSALVAKAAIHRQRLAVPKVLDDHVEHPASPMNDSSKPLSTCGPTRPEPTQRARGGPSRGAPSGGTARTAYRGFCSARSSIARMSLAVARA